MRNIFILYMPPGNAEAMVHFADTIHNKVSPDRIHRYVDTAVRRKIETIFGSRPVAVWGSRNSPANRAKFERMQIGDEVLIVEGKNIKLVGRVAAKTVSQELSRELWQNLHGANTDPWSLIYFIANPREIDLPFSAFCRLVGYDPDFQLHGFTQVARARLEDFYAQYDDLYSVLLRIRKRLPVEKIPVPGVIREESEKSSKELGTDKATWDEPDATAPEHLRLQWLLLRMGKQAGEKVWAPKSDQSRLAAQFGFSDFEQTFAAGLDTQVKYVENIDVVWKHEFRINAAFEVENSTSIYSGLLRFADLTMVAPNTLYPLFLVAPSERRYRIREQLARPTFRHLKIAEKVRYLSYEQVKQIDDFFGTTGQGMSVDVFIGKSERFA